jgi:hypothetical protein
VEEANVRWRNEWGRRRGRQCQLQHDWNERDFRHRRNNQQLQQDWHNTSGTTGAATASKTGQTGGANATANGSAVTGTTDTGVGPAVAGNPAALGQRSIAADAAAIASLPADQQALATQFNAAIMAAKQKMAPQQPVQLAQVAVKGIPGMPGIPPAAIPGTPENKALTAPIAKAIEGLFAPNENPVTEKPLAAIPPEQHLEQQPLAPLPAVQENPWATAFSPRELGVERQQPAAVPVTPLATPEVKGIDGPIGFPGTPLPPVQLPGTPAREPTKPEAIGGGFQSPTLDGLNTETLTHPAIDDALPGYVAPDMPVDMTISPSIVTSEPPLEGRELENFKALLTKVENDLPDFTDPKVVAFLRRNTVSWTGMVSALTRGVR